jgi:putative SOS response-associated peptidase YedK
MCGQFKAGFEFREIKVRWQIFNDLDFTPHDNITPTQTHPIIVERAGGIEARQLRWGLVPFLGQGSSDRQQDDQCALRDDAELSLIRQLVRLKANGFQQGNHAGRVKQALREYGIPEDEWDDKY